MSPEPVPAEPEWDDDPAWSRPDPMTAAEREAWLDHLAETDEPPEGGVRGLRPRSPRRSWPRSARRPLMSCSRSRRPPPGGEDRASPARRGSSPASRPARRPRSARGWPWTCCPAARAWRWPLTPRPGRTAGSRGVRGGADRGGVRLGPGRDPRAARKLAAVAELARRNPAPPDRGVHRRRGRLRAGGVPRPCGEPDRPGPDPGDPSARGPPRRWMTGRSPGIRRRSSPAATAFLDPDEARAAEAGGAGPGRPPDPGGAARRDRPRGDRGRPEQGQAAAARTAAKDRPGGTVGRGLPATPR